MDEDQEIRHRRDQGALAEEGGSIADGTGASNSRRLEGPGVGSFGRARKTGAVTEVATLTTGEEMRLGPL